MESPTEINLDQLSPQDLSALEEDLREQLRVYFRHIVGLAGAYEHIDADGRRRPQTPFFYSAAVIELCDQWYLLTAGHNLEKLHAGATRTDMKLVACGLDDTYAPCSKERTPIQDFDFVDAERFFQNADGIDFGLIRLRTYYRNLLKANGVEPLTEQHWNPVEVDACDVFLMVGFPEDSIDAGITFSGGSYHARAKGAPSVILIERVVTPPADCATTPYQRFVGKIRAEHDVGSIVGMSGGPIFCFKDHEFEPYFVAAIQSTWIKQSKMTFGCPLPLILAKSSHFVTAR